VPLAVTLIDSRPVTDSPSAGPAKDRDIELLVREGATPSSKVGAGVMGWANASIMTTRSSTEQTPLMAHSPLLPSFNPPIH
jgi:hypothetical protein